MKPSRFAVGSVLGLCLCLCVPGTLTGQWGVTAKAALPAVPYWWMASEKNGVELIPLVWTNDIDGGDSGCCVLGAAGRFRLGPSTLWFGLGFGTDPDAGTLAAIEVAAQINDGAVAFRSLNGRSGFAAFFPVIRDTTGHLEQRVSLGVSTVRLFDDRYIEPVPLFRCSATAPSFPCEPVPTPYPWSQGQDNAVVAEGVWGRGEWGAPRLSGSLGLGLKAVSGKYNYLRAELAAQVWGELKETDWSVRLAAGWVSGGSPLQRRFLLYSADPIQRWLNPYLDVKGALFADIPYIVPGGPNLRAYQATQPLADGYLGVLGVLGRKVESEAGLWGRLDGFFETAWIPGIPDRLGPDDLNEDASFLFDWRELPAGEDRPLGAFRARSLKVSELWADGGLALTGGFRKVAVMISLPLWASEPAFANPPIGGGEKKAIALRGTLAIIFFTLGRPGV
jgi:hypothetical protein